VDRYLYTDAQDPGGQRDGKNFPTYNVGGTECLVVTRSDAVCWIVYSHGNAVTLQDLFASGVAHEIAESCKCNFVAPAYPARCGSGQCYDKAVVAAALVAYERLCLDSSVPVYLAGRSLGVGVALGVCACASRPPAGLLMLSGFASVRAMTSWAVLRCLIGDRYDNVRAIALDKLSAVHKLIVHGSSDGLVPPEHALALNDAACGPTQLHVIEGMGHCPDTHWPEVYRLFRDFTNGHLNVCRPPVVYPPWP
jgi:pimeloyl-ACP methyl ester carboxylesterase